MKGTTLGGFLAGMLSIGAGSVSAFTIEMVADNDYAIFGGTSSSITSLLYQNNVDWPNQIANISAQNFALGAGENTFYVLAMDGGGSADISGEINSVNMTDVSVGAEVSTNVAGSLTGYSLPPVIAGTFNVSLLMAQNALGAAGAFSDAQPSVLFSSAVIDAGGFGSGFAYVPSSAVFFKFGAGEVGLSVPETSTMALMLVGLMGLCGARRKSKLPV
jgi:hypothetical protein